MAESKSRITVLLRSEETAGVLGESVHVVRHDLRFAHAWLRRRLAR